MQLVSAVRSEVPKRLRLAIGSLCLLEAKAIFQVVDSPLDCLEHFSRRCRREHSRLNFLLILGDSIPETDQMLPPWS